MKRVPVKIAQAAVAAAADIVAVAAAVAVAATAETAAGIETAGNHKTHFHELHRSYERWGFLLLGAHGCFVRHIRFKPR